MKQWLERLFPPYEDYYLELAVQCCEQGCGLGQEKDVWLSQLVYLMLPYLCKLGFQFMAWGEKESGYDFLGL
jgi:hypothetical protein